MNQQPSKWDASTKRIVALVLLILLALLVYRFRAVLPPLILGLLLAFILDPLVDLLERRTPLSRGMATGLVFIIVILGLATAPVVAVPPIVRAVRSLNLDFVQIIGDLEQLMSQPIEILGREWDLSEVYQELWTTLQSYLSQVASGTFDVVVGFASTLFWLIFIMLSSFYLVKDADRLVASLDNLAPPAMRDDFVQLRERITHVWHAFLRGQLLMGLLLAIITTIATMIVGLPNALALGLLSGLSEFVPNLGPIIAAIPAVAVAFFEGSTWIPLSNAWFAVLVLGVYILIQQIEGNVLLPRVMGRSLDLHPLAVLVAVIAGGSLAGILGMLLAAPTLATLRVLLEYLYRRLTDQDPFPEKQQPEPSRPGLARRLWYRLRRQSIAGQWTLRPAQAEDRPGVESLCSQSWNGEDYVPRMWDEWLADPHGELTIVTLQDQIVALGKLTRLAEGEWWMEGMRVDPAYRRLGIAGALQAHQVALAEQIGEGVLRFGTASYNQAIHSIARRDGFRHVAEFCIYKADSLPGPFSARLLAPEEEERIWEQIAGSPIWEAAAGLYELDWHWMELTRARLAAHLAAGEVWGIDWEESLAALAILPVDPERENLSVAYLDGMPEGIATLVWTLRSYAHQQDFPTLRLRPPGHPPLIDAIEAAGISSTGEDMLWIFERALGQPEPVPSTPGALNR